MKKIFWLSLSVLIVVSCSQSDSEKKTSKDTIQKQTQTKTEFKTDYELLNAMPNPIEITDLIKNSGIEYDNSLLNKSENVEKYNAEYQMALNMGVYSVDLGYTNLHAKTQDAIKYLDATRKMAEGLKVAQFFDFEKIKKITQESKDMNELIFTTGLGLTTMRQKLEEEKRGEVLTLMVVGGWVESLYLATQVAEKANKPALNEKIADQKLVVELILKELEANKSVSKHIEAIYNDMQKIAEGYKNISVEASAKEGQPAKVNMSKEDLSKLTQIVKEVRSRIIS
ncbi:MAG: hypothetical protein RMJ97_06115 [Raineya sp.]|nr:hypothetical protein [Raineya sp.]MDW8296448.1 hypothetical protein [Raineya sp.]